MFPKHDEASSNDEIRHNQDPEKHVPDVKFAVPIGSLRCLLTIRGAH